MHDLFERRVDREIVDVVPTVGQSPDLTFDITENGFADNDAFETTIYDVSRHKESKFQDPGLTASFADLWAVAANVMFPAARDERAAHV
jgi:hypothetical protein